MRLLTVNACAYCGDPIKGTPRYALPRDGSFSEGFDVPLCDRCGSSSHPTLQDCFALFAMTDDDGREWGPRPGPCVAHRGPSVRPVAVRCQQPAPDAPRAIRLRDDAATEALS